MRLIIVKTRRAPRAGFPLTFPLPESTLPQPSRGRISQVLTISVDRLGRKLGSLPEEHLVQILDGLLELIG